MDLYELLARMEEEGTIDAIVNDPLAQFGQAGNYLGAALLPERLVPANSYEESEVRFKSVIANSGERHSPAQIRRGGFLMGSFQVQTGSSDIAAVFDANDHDAIMNLLERQQDFEAAGFVARWVNASIVEPLRTLIERERWDAILDGTLVRTGDNGYTRTIEYPKPAGHRFAVADTWNDDTHDPFDDLFAGASVIQDKGYNLARIIMRGTTARILNRHPLVQQRMGNLTVNAAGTSFEGFGATRAQINGYLGAEGLPGIETYDAQYFTEEAAYHFLDEGTIVMVATTDLDETVNGPDDVGDTYLPNTLGYTAIGRPSGEANAGRAQVLEVSDRKPRTLTAEGWQESLPVITRPEAIVVMTGAAEAA